MNINLRQKRKATAPRDGTVFDWKRVYSNPMIPL